eukprot:TRINITY_DN123576_c0_g1_i1.p1 TRINITY_DN123576_c0_g1~~TRINITY_DN123576_c0_g1_i1.p1  ORF type:complete len:198 (-),score=40.81 TRINITY_DN123576_c0_g1_i1:171-764(-)
MFSLLRGLWDWLSQKEERRMVLLGIDNAGKTTTLEQMKTLFGQKGMPADRIPPTIGLNLGRIQIDSVVAVFWDLGGHASFRSVWHNYYAEVQGVMFVLDSADAARMDEARDTLVDILSHEAMRGVPVLCMANKQDLPDAMSAKEICRRLDSEQWLGNRPFHVHPCSALRGQGLEAGVRWLLAEAGKVKPKQETTSMM